MAAKKRPARAAAKSSAGSRDTAHRPAAARKSAAGRAGFPVVGIGASAGGLEALDELFGAMPADTGMAFVVVTHQHPDHTSLMPELLARVSAVPVVEAADGMKLAPNRVYISPPGGHLDILNLRLHRLDADRRESPHLPIDHFFRSLAQDQQEQAIGVILSGTGTDGTLGIKEIKGASGMVMVQEIASAKHAGMPASAIAAGLADYILPPAAMPAQLVAYARGPYLAAPAPDEPPEVPPEPMQKVLVLLRSRTGHDFSNYKSNTIRRRIERRMNVHQIAAPDQYVRYLQENPHEVDLLFKELLICVTSFFRDPEAFEALSGTALPELVGSRPDNHTLRAWIPACATGEEVYSLAMLMSESIEVGGRPMRVQIFGSDLNDEVIDTARSGRYPAGIALDVPPARLERYFLPEDGGFRIRKEIREMAIFAAHNVIKDPPFTKLDLIACRNLLIYLNAELQKQTLAMFHYALNPGGLLFLGPSESTGGFDHLFETVDKKWKIYRRKESPADRQPSPGFRVAPVLQPARSGPRPETRAAGVATEVERLLLEHFAPASVVVDEDGDVVFIHGRTGAYLEPAPGRPRLNLHDMAREGLKTALAVALRRAARERTVVSTDAVRVRANGKHVHVDLRVVRITEPEPLRGLFLVTFRPGAAPAEARRPPQRTAGKHEPTRIERVNHELQCAKESLQTTNEELETSNEELKSTNEELQSTNEELQSTNEELETSKEETQSLNEELTTVNAELQSKVEELSRSNDDMQNLLNSTEIATIFLDRALNINRYTEQAKRLVNLIRTDIGRPLTDLVSRLNHDGLVADCREVLRTLVFRETEVLTSGGEWYLMRIMPYRTAENVIDGLVLTFVNINAVKRFEAELAAAKQHLEADLLAMTRLFEIGTLFVRGGPLQTVLDEVLEAAICMTGADMGDIRLLDPASGTLRIGAQRGFKKAYLEFWDGAVQNQAAGVEVLGKGERVIVEDLGKSPIFAGKPELEVMRKAGVNAVQSTPLVSCGGKLLGVVTTHFRTPQRPDERSLRLLDLLARQTAEILESGAGNGDAG